MIDAELLAYLQSMEARLVAALIDPDRVRLQILLPQIHAQTNASPFAVSDLLGVVDFQGLTLPQIGKLFEHNTTRVFAGYQVIRGARSDRWRVVASPIHDTPAQATQYAPSKTRGAR